MFLKKRNRIAKQWAFFSSYKKYAAEWRKRLRPTYERYVTEVSSPEMAVSLETAVFLSVFLHHVGPTRVLDLGSGFSSFVMRLYGQENPEAVIFSVDDHDQWLQKTFQFLAQQSVSTMRVLHWDQFVSEAETGFDLIFHDLGNMETRKHVLHEVLQMLNKKGVVFLDDMHKGHYFDYVVDYLKAYEYNWYDLKKYTLDQYKRFGVLLADIQEK